MTANGEQTSWLCADPLLGLKGDQFLMLSIPQVTTPQQLWSVRHQFLQVQDRLAILDNQGAIFSDDEIRFHLFALSQHFVDAQCRFSTDPVKQLITIDPLITSAWVQGRAFSCEEWGRDHGCVFNLSLPVATAFLLGSHWVPVSMHPNGDTLRVLVWDTDEHDHLQLNDIIERLGLSMGFISVCIQRDRRMFSTTDLCGTLAVAYLHHVFLNVQLPANHAETTQRFQVYRDQFVQSFSKCDITRRPWVWGKGDRVAGGPNLLPHSDDMPVPAMLMRDQRIALISEHHNAVADDEIRFHLQHIISRFAEIATRQNQPVSKQFLFYEPLVFTCWESIGRTISARWSDRHPEVRTQNAEILTAFLLDNHWFPFWIVPHDQNLTFHTVAHTTVDAMRFKDVCACIGHQLGFPTFALHIVPSRLPDHDMCGAAAMMFLAHVVHGALLPDTVAELMTIHVNMRAAFVADLYTKLEVPAPVVWGNGICHWESGPLPQMPWESSDIAHDENTAHMPGESGPLPKMPCWSPLVAQDESVMHMPGNLGPFSQVSCAGPFVAHDERVTHKPWESGPLPQMPCASLLVAHHVGAPYMPVDPDPLPSMPCESPFVAHEESVTNVPRESGPLPTMPCKSPFVAPVVGEMHMPQVCDASETLEAASFDWDKVGRLVQWQIDAPVEQCPDQGICLNHDPPLHVSTNAMDATELVFHVDTLQGKTTGIARKVLAHTHILPSLEDLPPVVQHFQKSHHDIMTQIVLIRGHWLPIVCLKGMCVTRMFLPSEFCSEVACLQLSDCLVQGIHEGFQHNLCGAQAIEVISHVLLRTPLAKSLEELECVHQQLRLMFSLSGFPHNVGPSGFGPQGTLQQKLAAELAKHGVPENRAESRANEAIKVIGSEQLGNALSHKQPWKQLKALGNNNKFKFVLPSELAQIIDDRKNHGVSAKGKGKHGGKHQTQLDLDPNKLQVIDGTFRSQGKVVAQISPKQIGPVSSGVILITLADAEPYLRAAKTVSTEPLAMIVLHRPDVEVTTALPHSTVTVPCRCTVDNEPILADATIVQIGQGLVEKFRGSDLVELEALDVVTLKYLVYRDELTCSWEEFSKAPIKFLVTSFPILRRCTLQGCSCDSWHNEELLNIKEPILDVWRRQYLRTGFKPSPVDKAEIFSVCLRVPFQLLVPLLASSGTAGAYCEPRTADGTEVLSDYTVIWTPRLSMQEMMHLKQTNPAIIGVARVGDRKGVRVQTSQASTIHKLIRPDTVYLPQGQRTLFLVGPFPFGVDRTAISKAMKQTGWECRPLQPAAPVPGKGSMWIVQAVDEPQNSIVPTTHGEVVITKHKVDTGGQKQFVAPVASASTLALCGKGQAVSPETDPWNARDPWGGFKPTSVTASDTTESMQQLEVRVQNAVLAKLPAAPMEDVVPERVCQPLKSRFSILWQSNRDWRFSFMTFLSSKASNCLPCRIN